MKTVLTSLKHLNMFLVEFDTYNSILIASGITLLYLLFTIIKSGKSAVKLKKALSLLFFSFNLSFIFQITIIGRIGRHYDGWSVINGDWNIFENQYLLSSPQMRNIALFLMLMPSVFIFIKCLKSKALSAKLMMTAGILFPFVISLFIELCQGIFSIGTFQFSDLFYNTLGGLIGAVFYIVIQKLHKK
ncbi:MAG: VanZ family protein [Eubacterium sp.]|nr:VanZ family protein [Eubacterium sp.]